MEVPVTLEARFADDRPDTHLTITDLKTSSSTDDDLTIAQLTKSCPQSSLGVKRRKSKPMRFEVSGTDSQTENPPPKGVHNPLIPSLSFQKEKFRTKGFKTPVPCSPAMTRALDVQSRLGLEFPSCIKTMVKSQVSCGFWMGFPVAFCQSFLPKKDTAFILEDENGQQWEAKYIAYKTGLSAGWKTFTLSHKLIEGDVLVFHLVESSKFKVYILKENESNEVDGALSLLNLESPTEQITPVTPSPKTKRRRLPESIPSVVQKKHKRSTPSLRSLPNSHLCKHLIEYPVNDSEEVGSEDLEGAEPKSYKIDSSFQEIKTFEDFCTAIKHHRLDNEVPDEIKTGYYELCLDRKEFLHSGLRQGMYHKLVAGIIGETVTIANKIKNCKFTTTQDEFEGWDGTLKCFELMGMKVGFLRDRIHTLAKMAVESEGAFELKRYVDSENERKRVKDEIKKVGAKLSELMKTAKKFEGISSSLRKKADKYAEKFQNQVDAPW